MRYAERMRRIVGVVILLGVSCWIYGLIFGHSFVRYDDMTYVVGNGQIRKGVTWEGFLWAFSSLNANTSYWDPLTWLSHQLDCSAFGLNAGWHKLTNVVFHLYNTILIYGLLRRFPKSKPLACAAVAGLFAWHPLHVESVVWVSERKDVLSTFFVLLALHFYFIYVNRRSWKRYVVVLVCFACALMSKPMAVTLPALMLVLDFWPLRRWVGDGKMGNKWVAIWRLVREKLPFFVISGVVSMATVIAQSDLGIVPTTDELSVAYRISNALQSWFVYIAKMFVPTGLAVYYPYPDGFSYWGVLGTLVFFVGMSVWAAGSWRRRPYITFGWAWYVITLLPMIGLIQTSSQARADRYTYLALTGIFVWIVWGLDEWVRWRRRWVFGGLAGVGLVVFLPLTGRQVDYWKDTETLYRRAVGVVENSAVMHRNLGNALDWSLDGEEALYHLRRAVAIDPDRERAYTT